MRDSVPHRLVRDHVETLVTAMEAAGTVKGSFATWIVSGWPR